MQRPIYFFEPARRQNGDKIEGVFRMKVPEGTPNAILREGTLADGRMYSYWCLEASSITGRVRWIEKIGSKFGTKIVLVLESGRRFFSISIRYEAQELRNVMSSLCGLKGDLMDAEITISNWIYQKKNPDGSPKLNAKGKVVWGQMFVFKGLTPEFGKENPWIKFAENNGLEWVKRRNAKGEDETDTSAELQYWDKRMLAMMRWMLKQPEVLPLSYGSWIAYGLENPSGAGQFTPDEVQTANDIYQRRKADFFFPFRSQKDEANDVMDTLESANDVFPNESIAPQRAALAHIPPANNTAFQNGNAREVPMRDSYEFPDASAAPTGRMEDIGIGQDGPNDGLPF